MDDGADEEMFANFSPAISRAQQPDDVESKLPRPVQKPACELTVVSRKRGVSSVTEFSRIPKQSRVPTLAPISRVSGGLNKDGRPNKRVLLTREKLRAGIKDHRGLLDLSGPSTNALERTKNLELLKSAGFLSDTSSSKFSDNLKRPPFALSWA